MSRFTENARHKKIGWVLAEQQQQAIPGLKLYGYTEKTLASPQLQASLHVLEQVMEFLRGLLEDGAVHTRGEGGFESFRNY